MTMESWVDLYHVDEVPADGMYATEVAGKRLALYVISGRVYATDNVCSHAFALLTDGWLEDGLVECPLHGAQFDVTTGSVVRGPADCPIAAFEIRVHDGVIQVCVPDPL